MKGRLWTEDEIVFLRAHPEMSPAELSIKFKRTIGSVSVQRAKQNKLLGRSGPTPRSYTEDEIAYIRESYATQTVSEIADALGRSYHSVVAQARRQGITESNTHLSTLRRRPFEVGTRTLIARTCVACGLLKAASSFSRKGTSQHRVICMPCVAKRSRGRYKNSDQNEREKRMGTFPERMRKITTPQAHNEGLRWTAEEDRIVADTTRPLVLVALKTHRTYAAVVHRAMRLGIRRQKTRHSEERWLVIFDKIGVTRALELEAAGVIDPAGIPTETDWEWDSEPHLRVDKGAIAIGHAS